MSLSACDEGLRYVTNKNLRNTNEKNTFNCCDTIRDSTNP